MEIGDIVAKHGRRVARRIDADEDRLDPRGAGRIARLELAQARADHLQVDRADVGAEGEAEIDEPIFAGEIARR